MTPPNVPRAVDLACLRSWSSRLRSSPTNQAEASIMSNIYFSLAGGSLTQDWSNTGQITTNDSWSGVPSIQGFLGQDITTGTATDARTLTTDSAVANDLDVIANQNNTTITNGGVAEFDGIANPTIALQGSGTADAPHLVLYLDATGRQ